jgi:hypothetical protein
MHVFSLLTIYHPSVFFLPCFPEARKQNSDLKRTLEFQLHKEEKKMGRAFSISPLALSPTRISSCAKQTRKPILSPKCMDDKGMKFEALGGYLNF